ncbi:PAAR domain-containing protein [Propionivibrio soli]|uniref:PAAR domain-containing protein n=1 Tax=Propionivibrio soli TaxID=2976531 RepID=UPI0021E954B8|nr:PAAR domain-containing protein [Propionivibrio soli]
MKHVIRLGDPTSHGGTVVSAASNTVINGKQVARVGDTVTCPIKGHGAVTIVEGDASWSEDGRPVALEGHKTSCGASLISTLPTLGRSTG